MIRDRDVIELLRLESDKLERLQNACERLPADDPHRQQLLRLMRHRATDFSVAMWRLRDADDYLAGHA
jgi:hypothetical protein